ncbi:MAG: T9SS type A sorting domain-containing protein [Bacteroidota bacterium]|nr:T9SS type A sorting domain-containing protein [Bacteroidota bacterium]
MLLALLPIGFCTAQTIAYTYDAAGNRISRVYVVNLRSATIHTSPPDSVEVKAPLGPLNITVYPNPTKGTLVIDVIGLKEGETVQLLLFDPQGRQLLRGQGTAGSTRLDLSAYPTGWYLLRAIKKSEKIEFKIIKE